MEIYDSLLGAVCDEYDRVTLIKRSKEVTLIQGKMETGLYFQDIFR